MGLQATITDVLVRVQALDGTHTTTLVHPSQPWVEIAASQGIAAVAGAYLVQGIEHILFGTDHLLFVLGLLLMVRDRWMLLKTITAFTVAHSITLAAATLGFVSVPGPPIEAAIALSIVLVAVEIVNARRGTPSLAARWPWLIAFSFGLLHGFGFAGALAEIGLPHHAIPIALLLFNVGVEIGQLAFVAAVLTAGAILSRAMMLRPTPPQLLQTVNRFDVIAGYAIGVMAAFWLIERTCAFLV